MQNLRELIDGFDGLSPAEALRMAPAVMHEMARIWDDPEEDAKDRYAASSMLAFWLSMLKRIETDPAESRQRRRGATRARREFLDG